MRIPGNGDDGVPPEGDYFNFVPDAEWRRTFESVNGHGSSEGIQTVGAYVPDGDDRSTGFACAYIGDKVPILPHNTDNHVINVTKMKCLKGNRPSYTPGADPKDFEVMRELTWRQDKCAFVDDLTGSYAKRITHGKRSNIAGTDILEYPTWPMSHCPTSVQVVVTTDDEPYQIVDPLRVDLSDQSNYDSNFEVLTGSTDTASIVRHKDETYTCASSLLWNTSARDSQSVLPAESLKCCKGTRINTEGKCEGEMHLSRDHGVYNWAS